MVGLVADVPGLGEVWITPHSVDRFRDRALPFSQRRLDPEMCARVIRDGLQHPANIRLLHNGSGVRIRVRRPVAFRAVAVVDREHGDPHWVLATILDSRGARHEIRVPA